MKKILWLLDLGGSKVHPQWVEGADIHTWQIRHGWILNYILKKKQHFKGCIDSQACVLEMDVQNHLEVSQNNKMFLEA